MTREQINKAISESMKGKIRGNYSQAGKAFREAYDYKGPITYVAMGPKLWKEYYEFLHHFREST